MRSMEDVSLPAFYGAVEQSLPHFLGEEGIFPQLANILQDVGEGPTRWRGLLESGCRTGEELRSLWTALVEEALQMSTYLETEVQGPLAVQVEGAGQGSSDGSTRRRITTWLEDTRAATLKKGLEAHLDQQHDQSGHIPNLTSSVKDGSSPSLAQVGSTRQNSPRRSPGISVFHPQVVLLEWENPWVFET